MLLQYKEWYSKTVVRWGENFQYGCLILNKTRKSMLSWGAQIYWVITSKNLLKLGLWSSALDVAHNRTQFFLFKNSIILILEEFYTCILLIFTHVPAPPRSFSTLTAPSTQLQIFFFFLKIFINLRYVSQLLLEVGLPKVCG